MGDQSEMLQTGVLEGRGEGWGAGGGGDQGGRVLCGVRVSYLKNKPRNATSEMNDVLHGG